MRLVWQKLRSDGQKLCYHLHSAWVLCHHINISNSATIYWNKERQYGLIIMINKWMKTAMVDQYPAILMLPIFWKDLGTVMFWPQKCRESLPWPFWRWSRWKYWSSCHDHILALPIIFIILIIIVSILHHNHNQEDHHHHLPCLSPWWQPWPVAPEEAQVNAFWTSTWDVNKRLQQSTNYQSKMWSMGRCAPWQ